VDASVCVETVHSFLGIVPEPEQLPLGLIQRLRDLRKVFFWEMCVCVCVCVR
jgi:hypothetical protein